MRAGQGSLLEGWLPELVLVGLIAMQVIGVIAWDAETQRGTGFAMFSTVDIAATRDVKIEIRRDGQLSAHTPRALEKVREELVADPTPSRMSTLAADVLDEVPSASEVLITVHGLTADGLVYRRSPVAVYRVER